LAARALASVETAPVTDAVALLALTQALVLELAHLPEVRGLYHDNKDLVWPTWAIGVLSGVRDVET
jgi:hypothetical protein